MGRLSTTECTYLPTYCTSHSEPDAGPPTSGHTTCPLPTAPGVAQQVGPGKSHAHHRHANRTPTANGWGSTRGVQPVLEHAQTAATTGTTTWEPGPPAAARTSGVRTRRHCASSTPPGTQRTQNYFTTWQSGRQLVDATAAHGTQLLSATADARQADGQPHHLPEMWVPGTSHPMPPDRATGALPPHADGPRYPRTAPVAAHRLRTGLGEGHSESGVGPQCGGGMEIPLGNVGHRGPSHYLPHTGQTPQHHAGGPRLPGSTPLHPSPGLADSRMDHIPPTKGIPAPIYIRLPHTGPRREQPVCRLVPGGNRDHHHGTRSTDSLRSTPTRQRRRAACCARTTTTPPFFWMPPAPRGSPQRPGGQLWSCGRTRQADCTNTTSQGPPSSGPPPTGS